MHNRSMRRPCLALAVALAATALPVLGATVVRLTFEELTARAEVVVRGTVRTTKARLNRAQGRVWTFTQIDVSEGLKGSSHRSITVRQPGGEADGIGQTVAGAARFSEGEDVVVFLARAPDDPAVYQVLSLSAGKVRLQTTLSSKRAKRDLDGLQFAEGPSPSGIRLVSSEDLGDADAFVARIRAAAKAKGGSKP